MVIDMEKYVPYPLYYDDMPIDISFVFESERPAGTVSYTHLDVYKRQVVSLPPLHNMHFSAAS